MRKYKLTNSINKEMPLNDVKNGLLHSVGDLGYTDQTNYRRIGNVYRMISDSRGQDIITGTVSFHSGNAQEAYQQLVAFLQHKPLVLSYIPDGQDEEYFREGTVTQVMFQETARKSATITFKAFTPPYKYDTKVTEPEDETVIGKIYSEVSESVYGYTYDYTYKSMRNNSVEFDLDTAIESPCKLEFYGPLVNPVWTHYLNGEKIADGKVTRTVAAGHKLVVDTQSVPYSIKEFDENGQFVIDLYGASDFSKERFIMLRYGKNRIVVSDDNSTSTLVKCQGKIMYASV